MAKVNQERAAKLVLWGLIAPWLLVGGLGKEVTLGWLTAVGMILMGGGLLLTIKYGELKWPWGWWAGMGIFILLGVYSSRLPLSLWALSYWGLWVVGILGWWIAFTFRRKWRQEIYYLMVGLGLIYLALLLISATKLISIPGLSFLGLVTADSAFKNHYHLGDWWMLIIILAGFQYTYSKRGAHLIVMAGGTLIVLLSQSRSAILGLMVALILTGLKYNWANRYKGYWRLMMAGLALAFIGWSSTKGILLDRLYYWQAMKGIAAHPLGVGMDRFGWISKQKEMNLEGLQTFSFYAHNLFLEYLVGYGVVALGFVVWFTAMVARTIGRKQTSESMGYMVALAALSLNFMLDTTYLIPTMVLTWFILLALAQE